MAAAFNVLFFMSFSQAVGQDLVDNELVLEAVNQEAFELLEELKQGQGLVDMQGFEEQLRFVNAKWNDAKVKVEHEYHLLFSFSRFVILPVANIARYLLIFRLVFLKVESHN